MASIEEKVETLLQSKITQLGYDLYDVEYAKEGKNYFLRIFIKEQYFLEVSSPGIERVLRKDKHLDTAMGEKIEVSLYTTIDKKKKIEGILTGYDEEKITMTYENDEISIPRKDISQMKTKYDWNQ